MITTLRVPRVFLSRTWRNRDTRSDGKEGLGDNENCGTERAILIPKVQLLEYYVPPFPAKFEEFVKFFKRRQLTYLHHLFSLHVSTQTLTPMPTQLMSL